MNEQLKNYESPEDHHKSAEHDTPHKPEVDHSALEKQQTDLKEASRVHAEQHSAPSRLLAIEKDEPTGGFDIGTHQSLKKDSYASLLKQTQKRLPAVAKQFSKLVHQKNIEAISNVSAQTIARPSGLLGGGIGALLGSITLLYYSKHYGFRYNYAFFFVTFLAGFLAGLLVEILVRLIKRRT